MNWNKIWFINRLVILFALDFGSILTSVAYAVFLAGGFIVYGHPFIALPIAILGYAMGMNAREWLIIKTAPRLIPELLKDKELDEILKDFDTQK